MSSFLRFLLFATMVAIVVAVVAVPVGASLLAGNIARDAGFTGDNVQVSVDLLGPQLLAGEARSVHLLGSNIGVPHGMIGHADVTLNDVSLTDHSFSAVSGTLTGVRLNAPGGQVMIDTVTLSGPSHRTRATGTLSAAEARKLVRNVARDAGVQVDNVLLRDGQITLESGSQEVSASLRVAGNALVLDQPNGTSTVLVAPAPSEKWHVASVNVSPSGIQVGLDVDALGLASSLKLGN